MHMPPIRLFEFVKFIINLACLLIFFTLIESEMSSRLSVHLCMLYLDRVWLLNHTKSCCINNKNTLIIKGKTPLQWYKNYFQSLVMFMQSFEFCLQNDKQMENIALKHFNRKKELLWRYNTNKVYSFNDHQSRILTRIFQKFPCIFTP